MGMKMRRQSRCHNEYGLVEPDQDAGRRNVQALRLPILVRILAVNCLPEAHK